MSTEITEIPKKIKWLTLATVSPAVKLTRGQTALLKEMRASVESGKPIGWETIVNVFYNNVRKTVGDSKYVGSYAEGTGRYEYFRVDIIEAFKEQTSRWQYTIRPRIRQWFVSTIGILVLKNQLIVIPTIELPE